MVRWTLDEGGGVGVGVGVGVGDVKSVTLMLSKLIRFAPPDTLRISNRIEPALLTVNEAVLSDVELVVIVEPTFDQVEPLFVDLQSSQVLVPSDPYFACWIETEPALVTLKFIRTAPVSRTRADHEPVFRSLVVFPVSASERYQLPDPRVTFAAAYALLPPASKPSVRIVAAFVPSDAKTNAKIAMSIAMQE
jgi:hypothetical protein